MCPRPWASCRSMSTRRPWTSCWPPRSNGSVACRVRGWPICRPPSRNSFRPARLPSFPGLAWVVSQGVEQLRKHNLALSHQLLEVADAHRLQLLSPRVDEQRGGSVMVAIPRAVDAAQLQRQLAAQGLITDTRGDCMRWSPGPVTRATAIERLHAALKSALPR